MTNRRTSTSVRLKSIFLAGVTVAAVAAGAPETAQAADSAAAVRSATASVDRAWQDGRVREQHAVRTRIAGSRATLSDRRGNTLGVSIAGVREGAGARRAGRTTLFADGLGAAPSTASALQLLVAAAATVTVAHCTASAGAGGGR